MPCKCFGYSDIIVNCASRALTVVPIFSKNISDNAYMLLLNNNNLTWLDATLFPNLHWVSLENNPALNCTLTMDLLKDVETVVTDCAIWIKSTTTNDLVTNIDINEPTPTSSARARCYRVYLILMVIIACLITMYIFMLCCCKQWPNFNNVL